MIAQDADVIDITDEHPKGRGNDDQANFPSQPVPETSTSAASRKENPIWKYFERSLDPKKATCLLCKIGISRGGIGRNATTTSMSNHLRRKHEKEFKKYTEQKESSEAHPTSTRFSSNSRQMTLPEALNPVKVWDITDPKATKLHYAIAEMIAIDNQPFSFVENSGFRNLMSKAESHYQIPGRTFFITKIVPEMYKRCKSVLMQELSKSDHVCTTTDVWTASHCNESFLSLSAHWISKEFEYKHAVLNCSHFPGSHTGDAIAEKIMMLLQEWNIFTKLHVILRDNGRNIVSGVNNANLPNESCLLHTLQLAIEDSIRSQRAVNDMLAMSRKIATRFGHSSCACTRLKEIQIELKMDQKKIIQDVSTRWNSTFYMIQRMLEEKNAISVYTAETDLINLSENQWNLLKSMLALLQPFEELTKIISESESVISEAIPNVSTLLRYLQKDSPLHFGVKTMKETLKSSIETRFHKKFSNEKYTKATFLDPRFKLNFTKAESQSNLKSAIVQELLELEQAKKDNPAVAEAATSATSSSALGQEIHSALWECYSEIASENRCVDDTDIIKIDAEIRSEIAIYISTETLNRKESPFRWWKDNYAAYPRLGKLAKKYLSAPASSVYSERLFSAAGNIYEDKRNRMLPNNGEMLAFLNRNLHMLNFEY